MPTGVQTLSGIPRQWDVGSTLLFQEQFTNFPNTDWTAKLWLNLNGTAAPVVTATNSGDYYLFNLANTVTAALAPGQYEYSMIVTNAGTTQTATPKWGMIDWLPNFAVNQTASFAQSMVTLIQTALTSLATNPAISVSFNGQSYSTSNLSDLQMQYTFWKAMVNAETDAVNALRGNPKQNGISPRFNPPATAPYWFRNYPPR